MSSGVPTVYPHVAAWLAFLNETRRPLRVLEQGAGAGQYAKFFAAENYVSIDVPETWYAIERRPTAYASASALPFADRTFDLIFSVAAFDYFPEPHAVLAEAARVLRPSGVCMIFTYDLSTLQRIHENCMALPQERAVIGHHVLSRDDLKAMATRAGFSLHERTLMPRPGVVDRLRGLLRPGYHRVFALEKTV